MHCIGRQTIEQTLAKRADTEPDPLFEPFNCAPAAARWPEVHKRRPAADRTDAVAVRLQRRAIRLVLRPNSGMVMTGAMVAAALPQAIVSVFGGVWVDRWNRKLLVMLPDAVIAAVTICLSASMAVGWGDTGLILVVLVIRSAGGGIQTPAVQSFIPQIAPEAWLLRVNAINGTLQTAISIASPAIAAASSI